MPVLSDFLQSIDKRNEARIVQLDQKLEKTLGSQSQQGSHILSLLSNSLIVHIKATNTGADGTMVVAITATRGPPLQNRLAYLLQHWQAHPLQGYRSIV